MDTGAAESPASAGTRESARRRPRRSRRQRLVLAGGVGATALVLGGAGGLWLVDRKVESIQRVELALPSRSAEEVAGGTGPENFLVVGSDTRANITAADPRAAAMLDGENRPGLSDSIMIVRVTAASSQVQILSIPRDLWVPIHGTGRSAKINTAFAGGAQTLIDTIHDAFGIPIDHFVSVDFAGFQQLVDRIGGVPVYFDTAMRDQNSGLDVPGDACVTLNGSDALAFARSRHLEYRDPAGRWRSDNANDFGRMQRQQFLARMALKQIEAHVNLANLAQINDILSTVLANVTVDQQLSVPRLVALARQLHGLDPDAIATTSIPATRYHPAPDGSDALRVVEDDTILEAFGARPTRPPTDSTTRRTTPGRAKPAPTTTGTTVPATPEGRLPDEHAPQAHTCTGGPAPSD